MVSSRPPYHTRRFRLKRDITLLLSALALGLSACRTLPPPPPPPPEPEPPQAAQLEPDTPAPAEICKLQPAPADSAARAESFKLARLEREVIRLREDLRQAEEAIVAADSELGAGRNRANAVSMLADARISLETAEQAVPWKRAVVEAAMDMVADGEHQLIVGRAAAAVYFASRAQSIADSLIAEGRSVEGSPDARFVNADLLNLRVGPSVDEAVIVVLQRGTPIFWQRTKSDWLEVRTLDDEVGWVHASLVSQP